MGRFFGGFLVQDQTYHSEWVGFIPIALNVARTQEIYPSNETTVNVIGFGNVYLAILAKGTIPFPSP